MPDTPRRGSLLVIFLTVLIDLLGFGIVLPLLPIYGQQFARQYALSPAEVGWLTGALMSSFSAMQFLFAPLWGRLSDRVGRRPVLMCGLAGSAVCYAVFGLATVGQSLGWLFAARLGAGISGATISTAQAYIADVTSLSQRTRGMALVGAAFGVGFTFGPLLGALAMTGSGEQPGPGPGYAAAALSLAALMLAAVKLEESLLPGAAVRRRSWLGLAALREARVAPSVGMLIGASFVCVLAFANFESTIALVLKADEGAFRFDFSMVMYTFAYIGLTLTVIQGGVVRRLSGRVADDRLARWGAMLMIAGMALLAWSAREGSVPWLLAGLAVTVCGFAFFTPAVNALVSRRSDPARQGSVLGVLQSCGSLARIVGPVVGLRLLHAADGGHAPEVPLVVAAGCMGLGFVLVTIAAGRGEDFAAARSGRGAE
jgi:MFS family permease